MPEGPFQVAILVQPAPPGAHESTEVARGFVDGPNGRPVRVTLVAEQRISSEGSQTAQPQLAVLIDDRRLVIDISEMLDVIAEAYYRTNSRPPRILKLRPRSTG